MKYFVLAVIRVLKQKNWWIHLKEKQIYMHAVLGLGRRGSVLQIGYDTNIYIAF